MFQHHKSRPYLHMGRRKGSRFGTTHDLGQNSIRRCLRRAETLSRVGSTSRRSTLREARGLACAEEFELNLDRMADEETNLRLEIGHVLFIDIVAYSKLLIEEQKERLRQLTDIVLATAQVRKATNEQLVRLPTGDGMALVFRNSVEEPARCALEITEALHKEPGSKENP